MLAFAALLGFLLLTPIHCQRTYKSPVKDGCEDGKCCIPGVEETLNPGDSASAQDGKCQDYTCNDDNTYTVTACDVYIGCKKLTEGDSSQPYPDCCTVPDPDVDQGEGCKPIK